MYCPKCNLHSEEYVDKCPLCDGPMEVDEVASGVMKTPTIPEKEEETADLPKDKTLELTEEDLQEDTDFDAILSSDQKPAMAEKGSFDEELMEEGLERTEKEVQDATVALDYEEIAAADDGLEELLTEEINQEEKEVGEISEPLTTELDQEQIESEEAGEDLLMQASGKKEEELGAEEERLYQQEIPSKQAQPVRKKLPLIIGGGTLLVVILAALGYFFLLPSEKIYKPEKKEIAAVKKKASPIKTPVILEKAEPAPPIDKDKALIAKKTEIPKPLSEKKEPLVKGPAGTPADKAERSEPETEPQKPELSIKQPLPISQPSAKPPVTVAEPKKVLAEPSSGVALPSTSPQGRYSIHVGSFKAEYNAHTLRDRLSKKGYSVSCHFVKIPVKGDWYRVKVGYYSTRKEAQQVAIKLKSEEKVSTLILKRK